MIEPINNGLTFSAARERAGISQSEASRRSGVSTSAISLIEQGNRVPSVFTAWRLADTYGCSLDELVGRDKPPLPLVVTVHTEKPLAPATAHALGQMIALAAKALQAGEL